jgi:hypothetical protein
MSLAALLLKLYMSSVFAGLVLMCSDSARLVLHAAPEKELADGLDTMKIGRAAGRAVK